MESQEVIFSSGSDPTSSTGPELWAKQKNVLAFIIPCIFMVMSEITQAGWHSFDLPPPKHILSQEFLITGGRLTSNITGWGLKENDEMRKKKKKTEKRREGRKRPQIWLSLYNEAIWWHKSVVSEVFLQASLFISYICKVPENISVTLNRNHLLPHPLPIVIPRVGILSLL